MLRNLGELDGYRVVAGNEKVGKVTDFYFDDQSWQIRYVIVDTGGLFVSELILVSPACFGASDWMDRTIPVHLTREQIEQGPNAMEDPPLSRRMEIELARHYRWPVYWNEPMAVPFGADAEMTIPGDPNLRSAKEVAGYHIDAKDERFGHLEDVVVDVDDWQIRYLVVDTRNWLPGKQVLVTPGSVSGVDWRPGVVHIELTGEQIRQSPVFDPHAPVNREWQSLITDVSGRPV